MNRRNIIKSIAVTSASVALGKSVLASIDDNKEEMLSLKGNINHSVASWTYNFLPLDEMCYMVKKIGMSAIDLLAPKDWPTIQKHGITCSMCYTAGKISLTEGWNDPKNHDWLIKDFTEAIPMVAAAGYKNLICFSGNRNGMDDIVGMKNCAEGLKKIMPLAEKHGVIIQMELFNSKVDHKDYMCDKSAWGVALCKMIGSANFKLLYDIYHMQINEGDVIRTIKENHLYFGHYHTAGVPGRNEIDDTQELFYPAIMKAIVDTGYKGYVAQEFMSKEKDNAAKVKSLKRAVKICDV
jgi:hydroxypyruvate isomerase